MIVLKEVTEKEKALLWNIYQKYLYEMTVYYPDEMDKDGNYHYGYFDAYFVEPERKVFFIYDDAILVGFAMVNPYSYLDHHPDHVIAEFTIFPSYRGKHFASDAAQLILDTFPGKWEIKYSKKNTGAKRLWETLTRQYHPTVYHLNDEETVLEFSMEQLLHEL